VPRPDGDFQVLAQAIQAPELIVDEGFKWSDVDDQTLVWLLEQMGQGGEERRLGFTRRRAGRHENILVT
jgi:hypothetical protein